MAFPAFQALRTALPDARIAVLARPWVADLFERQGIFDDVIPTGFRGGMADLGRKWDLARRLRRKAFDCAILFPNSFESALIARAAGISERIGYRRDGRGPLLTLAPHAPERHQIPAHQRFYYLELLRRAGLIKSYDTEAPIRFEGADQAARAGQRLFATVGLQGAVIGVAPGAAFGGAKRWLPERFAEAATQRARDRNAAVAIFGSSQETAIAESVCTRLSHQGVESHNFAGKTSLAQLVDGVAACSEFLTNDSGSMHIASALGIPTVAVFGATDPQKTGPTGANSAVIWHSVDCSPCLLRECPIDHRCMYSVAANEVAAAARQLVQLTAAGNQR